RWPCCGGAKRTAEAFWTEAPLAQSEAEPPDANVGGWDRLLLWPQEEAHSPAKRLKTYSSPACWRYLELARQAQDSETGPAWSRSASRVKSWRAGVRWAACPLLLLSVSRPPASLYVSLLPLPPPASPLPRSTPWSVAAA